MIAHHINSIIILEYFVITIYNNFFSSTANIDIFSFQLQKYRGFTFVMCISVTVHHTCTCVHVGNVNHFAGNFRCYTSLPVSELHNFLLIDLP